MSALIGLLLPSDGQPLFFSDLGYELAAIELPMVDRDARQYQVDLLLVKPSLNLSMLVDCKADPENLKAEQISKYMNTTGTEVIVAGSLTVDQPRNHRVNPIFFVLPQVQSTLAALIRGCPAIVADGWGIVVIEPSRFRIVHDELSDADLSASLAAGWEVRLEALALERLPYTPDAPRWELADVLMQTIMAFYVSGRREFDVEDLCSYSNGLWPYLESQHGPIRNRVRHELRTIRRTALKGWIVRVDRGTGREERWRFGRQATTSRRALASFARRHQLYVSILRGRGEPSAEDFVRIDPEQLTLPFIVAETAAE